MKTRMFLLLPFFMIAACTQAPPVVRHEAAMTPDECRQVKELMDLIANSISPETWHSIHYPDGASPTILHPDAKGTLSYIDNRIVVSQTPEIQSEVESLMQILRQDRIPSVSIEASFLVVDRKILDGLRQSVYLHETALDSSEVDGLMRKARQSDASTILTPSKVRVTYGQAARIRNVAKKRISTDPDVVFEVSMPRTIDVRTDRPALPDPEPFPQETETQELATRPAPAAPDYPVAPIDIRLFPAPYQRDVMINLHIADGNREVDAAVPNGKTLMLLPHPIARSTLKPADNRVLIILLKCSMQLRTAPNITRFGGLYDAPNAIIPPSATEKAR